MYEQYEPRDVERYEQAFDHFRRAGQSAQSAFEALGDERNEIDSLGSVHDALEQLFNKRLDAADGNFVQRQFVGYWYERTEAPTAKRVFIRDERRAIDFMFGLCVTSTNGDYDGFIIECVDADTGEDVDYESLSVPVAEAWQTAVNAIDEWEMNENQLHPENPHI